VTPPPAEETAVPTVRKKAPRPSAPKKQDDLSALRARARKAGSDSRVGVAVTTRISRATFKDLVELAEEYRTPFTQMTRQCLEDGIRAYRAPSSRGPVLRRFPELVANESLPSIGSRSPSRIGELARRAKADAVVQPIEEPEELELPDYVNKAMANIPPGAMLPSAPALSEMPQADLDGSEMPDDETK